MVGFSLFCENPFHAGMVLKRPVHQTGLFPLDDDKTKVLQTK